MPTHESPPPSIRGIIPEGPSRAPTPVSGAQTPRPSALHSSRSSSRWALDNPKKEVTFKKEKGTAWYAGFGAARVLEHRWFSWIKPKLKWKFLKPVVRCAIAVSLLVVTVS